MKPLSHRSNQAHGKQNLNFLNGIISPKVTGTTKTRPINEINIQKYSTTGCGNNLCFTEDGRQATHFYLSDDDEIFKYCQKCSIMLASKGFNVDKLPKVNQSPNSKRKSTDRSSRKSISKYQREYISRQKKMINAKTNRLATVAQLKSRTTLAQKQLQSRCAEVQNSLMQSGDNYANIIQQITSYFKIIQQLVQYQKYLAYNRVLTQRVNNEKMLRQYKEQMMEVIDQLENINQDLIDNEDVVLTVNDQQFSSIIQNYQCIVQSVPDVIESQPEIEVIQNVSLPPIPEILNKLTDSIVFVKEIDQVNQPCSSVRQQVKDNALRISALSKDNIRRKYNRSPIVELTEHRQLDEPSRTDQTFIQNESQTISQHSFSNKRVIQRGQMHLNNMNKCPKQILLQNSFSIASSIVNRQCESFEEEEQDYQNSHQQKAEYMINFLKNYHQYQARGNQHYRMEESLGQYFMTDQTLMLNQTEQQRSQTLLLNQ